ncbi:MAG: ribbon-helix-helix domain-containing protein [Clostridia bacterium]
MGNPNLKNRVIPNSAIDKELYSKLKEYSKETSIPISKLLDKAIEMLLKSAEK